MTYEHDSVAALEAALGRVRSDTARARAAAQEAGRMSDDVRSATATAVSVGRDVRVTARAGGGVERIDIADAALGLDAATLSRLVTATVQQAQRDAADAALRRMSETLGENSPLVAATRARTAAQFGTAERGR